LSNVKIGTFLILALGLIIAGAGIAAHQQVAAQSADNQTAEKKAPQEDAPPAKDKGSPAAPAQPDPDRERKDIPVAGRVLDAGGEPIANASVAIMGLTRGPVRILRIWDSTDSRPKLLAEGKTDAEGRFRLNVTNNFVGRPIVSAKAKGQALCLQEFDPDARKA